MDKDMMEMMGFSGFGKKKVEKASAIPQRLQSTKREEENNKIQTTVKNEEELQEESHIERPTLKTDDEEVKQEKEDVKPEISNDYNNDNDDENDDDNEDDEYEVERDSIPTSHEVLLSDHSKAVTALDLDAAGSRLLSGSHDYDIKLWDFAAMNTTFKPFKSYEGCETNHIHDLKYSRHGDTFLAISGLAIPKLFTRDGDELAKWIKGDMYLKDMRQTKGHVTEISNCQWHPSNDDEFITCGGDSTVRIWDITERRNQKTVVAFRSKERGTRTKVTSCAYSNDGKQIAATGFDGALQIWSTSGTFARPNASNDNAHSKHTWTSSLVYTPDNKYLVSRGGDDTVKTWDIRNIKRPLNVKDNLPSLYQETNVSLSPDGKYILTGVSGKRGETRPSMIILDRDTLNTVKDISIGHEVGGSVIRTLWHSRINQIIASTSFGGMHVLYDPMTSVRGALMPLEKAPKRARDVEDVLASTDPDRDLHMPIITPTARQGDERSEKRKRAKKESEMRKPQPPMIGAGRGGRVGASATQAMVQRIFKDNTLEQDPREELLKYADKDDDPKWTKAWKNTGNVFDRETEEQMNSRIENENKQNESKK